MTLHDHARLFLLGEPMGEFAGFEGEVLRTPAKVLEAYGESPARWVLLQEKLGALLADLVANLRVKDHRLLVLSENIAAAQQEFMKARFGTVVFKAKHMHFLPVEELREALVAPNCSDLFIGVAVDDADRALILTRGNLETLVVPFGFFRGRPVAPEFSDAAITDYGQTVRLGEFEASADAILYEFDTAYRQEAKARQIEKDSTLGGSIRRLRLSRGLARSDFESVGVSAKEVARIERGEVTKPRDETLRAIAKILRVKVDDLPSY